MPVYTLSGFDIPGTVVLADFPEVLRQINARAALIVQREARDNAFAFRDTGALARSIQAQVDDLTVTISVPANQPTAAYANVMELGRTAGRHPPRVAPPERNVLAGWMRRHGIPESAAYVIARAIGQRGIRGRLYMERAYRSLEQQMPAIINTVMGRMGLT